MPIITGINYNDNDSSNNPNNPPVDFAYVYNLGVKKIRLYTPHYDDPTSITRWRGYVQTAITFGFTKIIYGLSFGPGANWTLADEAAYTTAIQAEATWVQSLGDSRIEFQVGNEEVNHKNASVTLLQVRDFMRTCATNVKAIYTLGLVSYAESATFSPSQITSWAGEGLGNLDRLGWNVYDGLGTFSTILTSITSNFTNINSYISEFNNNGSLGYSAVGNEVAWAGIGENLKKQIENSGITEYHYFDYVDGDDNFGIRTVAGNYRYIWPFMLGTRRWFQDVPNSNLSNRSATSSRGVTAIRVATSTRGFI